MKIKWDGRVYEYDPAQIDVNTGIKIREHTGMGIRSWERAIDDADPVALQALLWVIKEQNGERTPIRTLNFSVVDFHAAIMEAALEELAGRSLAEDVAPDAQHVSE